MFQITKTRSLILPSHSRDLNLTLQIGSSYFPYENNQINKPEKKIHGFQFSSNIISFFPPFMG